MYCHDGFRMIVSFYLFVNECEQNHTIIDNMVCMVTQHHNIAKRLLTNPQQSDSLLCNHEGIFLLFLAI